MSPPGPGTVRSRTSATAGPSPHSASVSMRWLTRACSTGISWEAGPGAASIPASTASILGSSTPGRLCERGVQRRVPAGRDRLRRVALLLEDRLDRLDRVLVAGAAGDPPQLLVAADLQVLERVGERGELAPRVRLQAEEHAPVQAAHVHRRVLELRRAGVVGLEALLDDPRVLARLLQVLLVAALLEHV